MIISLEWEKLKPHNVDRNNVRILIREIWFFIFILFFSMVKTSELGKTIYGITLSIEN